MTHFARLRPRLTRLTIPILALALISAATSFFSVYELDTWAFYTLWISAGLAALIAWVIPSLKFVATFVDVTSNGLTVSAGFGANRRQEIAWTEIKSVSASAMRGIVIGLDDESELVLRGYANQKAIAAELQALLRGK